jgi:hypothetical protein
MPCYSIATTNVVVKAAHWSVLVEGLKNSNEITGVYVTSARVYGSVGGVGFNIQRPREESESVNVEVFDNGVAGVADRVKNTVKRSYSHQAIKVVTEKSRWPLRKTGTNTYVAMKLG